jgi:hypothetical protein
MLKLSKISLKCRPKLCPRLGASAAFAGASADQFAFELGQPAKDGQHQAPVRRGRVRPCVGKGFESGAAFRDLRQGG